MGLDTTVLMTNNLTKYFNNVLIIKTDKFISLKLYRCIIITIDYLFELLYFCACFESPLAVLSRAY